MLTRHPPGPGGDIRVKLTDKTRGRLTFRLSYSSSIRRYFKQDVFFVEYGESVEAASDSILYIPAIANLAPVSWAIGANLHVEALDATFLESLRTIKGVMKGMYPDFSCAGDIIVDNIVQDRIARGGSAQLFTGGIDSLATYIRHRDEKPDLISYAIFTPYDISLQRHIYEGLSWYTREEKAAIHIVRSNMNDFFNQDNLIRYHGRNFREASWWASVQHGMGLLGMCAPLTATHGFGTVYIASTSTLAGAKMPTWKCWGSHPDIDGNVAWADVKVRYDCTEWSRQEKIKYAIRPYIEKTGKHPPIIVCNQTGRGPILNCGRCEKCYRTILGLALAGIDPSLCGFHVDGRTFDDIREKLLDPGANLIDGHPNMWRELQDSAAGAYGDGLYGSKRFFEWFKGYKIHDYVPATPRFYAIRARARRVISDVLTAAGRARKIIKASHGGRDERQA